MKILFNTYYHAFQNSGGGEVVLLKTREALLKKGIQVDLFNPWETKFNKYDLIHNFATLNYRDWDGFKSFVPKLVVTPVLWPHTGIEYRIKEKIKNLLNNIQNKKSSEINFQAALKNVDCFFPTTEMEEIRIKKRYGLNNSPFRIIPNGVDVPEKILTANQFFEKFKVNNYFLFVGRISPLKNVDKIIKAIKDCNETLVIIGKSDLHDFEYEKNLREIYKNDKKILFIGSLPHNSILLNDAYYGAKALIVASNFETCSLVGLEAGIRGTPVIMTNKGATLEVYQDKVRYIDPNHFETLNQEITNLNLNWNEDSKKKLKMHIEGNYSWEIIAEKLINEYKNIISS